MPNFSLLGRGAREFEAAFPRTRRPRVELAETGRAMRTGTVRIGSEEDLAHFAASMRRSPQEEMVYVVADRDGNILRAIHSTRGGPESAAVDLSSIGAALEIPEAAKIWVLHNHPSGTTVLSDADRTVSLRIADILDGSDVEYGGLAAVGENGAMGIIDGGGTIREVQPTPMARRQSVPLAERRFRDRGKRVDRVDSASSVDLADALQTPGVLLMDSQLAPVGFVPIEDFGRLRGDTAKQILSEAHRRGGTRALIVSPDPLPDPDLKNTVTMLKVSGIEPTDALIAGESAYYRTDSLARQARLWDWRGVAGAGTAGLAAAGGMAPDQAEAMPAIRVRSATGGTIAVPLSQYMDILRGTRVGQRNPTGAKATESGADPSLVISEEVMQRTPKQYERNAMALGGITGVRTRAKTAAGRAKAFRDHATENLLWIYDNALEPLIKQRATEWYRGANRYAQALADRTGTTIESAAGALAALSPQKDWHMNASLANRVARVLSETGNYRFPDAKHAKAARRIYGDPKYRKDLDAMLAGPFESLTPTQKAMFVRSYDEAYHDPSYPIMTPEGHEGEIAMTADGKPARVAWGDNRSIAKAIQALELKGEKNMDRISDLLGDAHKVRSFYNNIVDPDHARVEGLFEGGDTTIDTHAVAANTLLPVSGKSVEVADNFGASGGSSITGAMGTYGVHADATRAAAKERGVQPREMQSITWEAIRSIFEPSFKRNPEKVDAVRQIWRQYERGRITADDARSAIVELAGGFKRPDWSNMLAKTGPVIAAAPAFAAASVPEMSDDEAAIVMRNAMAKGLLNGPERINYITPEQRAADVQYLRAATLADRRGIPLQDAMDTVVRGDKLRGIDSAVTAASQVMPPYTKSGMAMRGANFLRPWLSSAAELAEHSDPIAALDATGVLAGAALAPALSSVQVSRNPEFRSMPPQSDVERTIEELDRRLKGIAPLAGLPVIGGMITGATAANQLMRARGRGG